MAQAFVLRVKNLALPLTTSGIARKTNDAENAHDHLGRKLRLTSREVSQRHEL
jgi:hypothetical protein